MGGGDGMGKIMGSELKVKVKTKKSEKVPVWVKQPGWGMQSCKMSQIWQIYLCKNIKKLG